MTERIFYVQWIPRLGTEAERLEAARQGRCHHDYWSELVEVAPPPSEEKAEQ